MRLLALVLLASAPLAASSAEKFPERRFMDSHPQGFLCLSSDLKMFESG